MLKKSFIFFMLLCGFISSNLSADGLNYNVQKKVYPMSVVFEMTSAYSIVGSVVKSPFRVRTNYDLYDRAGNYQATAVCRILTLGLFYDWGTEMDVYNPQGGYLGMIDGQVVTGASAKFSFYDGRGNHVGIAYLDKNCLGFTITNPNNEYQVIAQYTRRFVENTIDSWDVVIFEKSQVPVELLHIFAAFAVDRQSAFKEDT